MSNITFNNVELHLQEHPQHEFLLSNKEVALGYGVTQSTLRSNLQNHKDELIENKHWLRVEVQTKGGKQKVIHWTKKGIVRLGFFIKSKEAKAFRDWAEDYIVNERATKTQIDMITPYEVRRDLTTARRLLTLEKKKHRATAEYFEQKLKEETARIITENRRLKQTLIEAHNNYAHILDKFSLEKVEAEVKRLTRVFQGLPSLANDGKNLNTETQSGHKYFSF